METRKVQLSGGTTFTISLPKAWAKEHGIETGSLLYLYPDDDGTLVVESNERSGADERGAIVTVTGRDVDAVRETVKAIHVVGFDRIELVDPTGHPNERHRAVRDVAAGLSGLEVLEESDDRIVLRNLIDARNVSIRKSALRLELVMLAMHRDAVTAVVEADADLAEGVIERDGEADKLFALITRHFRRSLSDLAAVEKLDHSRDELFEFYYVARQFERIADHAEKMARLGIQQPAPPPADLAEVFTDHAGLAGRIVERAADVILADADVESAYRAIRDCDELVAELDEADRALYDHDSAAEAHTAGLLLDSVKRTGEYGANIADLAVQRAARLGEL